MGIINFCNDCSISFLLKIHSFFSLIYNCIYFVFYSIFDGIRYTLKMMLKQFCKITIGIIIIILLVILIYELWPQIMYIYGYKKMCEDEGLTWQYFKCVNITHQ